MVVSLWCGCEKERERTWKYVDEMIQQHFGYDTNYYFKELHKKADSYFLNVNVNIEMKVLH